MESNLQRRFTQHNSTPLAQFSEVKAPMCQYSLQNSFYKLSPRAWASCRPGPPTASRTSLSRPVAAPNSSLLPGYPRVAGFSGLGSQGVYYGPQVGSFSKAERVPHPDRNCWADLEARTGEAGGSATAVVPGGGGRRASWGRR